MGRQTMYYGADIMGFKNAKVLRNNLTSAERLLRNHLSKNKLGVRFNPQHPISNYIVDFYCHAAKLVIELDGDIHFDDNAQQQDAGRQTDLENLGVIVARFTNEQVFKNVDAVISQIRTILNERLSPNSLQRN